MVKLDWLEGGCNLGAVRYGFQTVLRERKASNQQLEVSNWHMAVQVPEQFVHSTKQSTYSGHKNMRQKQLQIGENYVLFGFILDRVVRTF